MTFKAIGVIGIGNIGSGVVIDLLLHGIHAVAVDLSEERRYLRRDARELLHGSRGPSASHHAAVESGDPRALFRALRRDG